MLNYFEIANQSDCLEHQDHWVSIIIVINIICFIYLFIFWIFSHPTRKKQSQAIIGMKNIATNPDITEWHAWKYDLWNNLKTISFLADVHMLAFRLRCHAGEVNFELTLSLPCTYHSLFPCVNTIVRDVNCVKTTSRWLWSYRGLLWRDINLRKITDLMDKLLTEVGCS